MTQTDITERSDNITNDFDRYSGKCFVGCHYILCIYVNEGMKIDFN
jgi:hypothetical protein